MTETMEPCCKRTVINVRYIHPNNRAAKVSVIM